MNVYACVKVSRERPVSHVVRGEVNERKCLPEKNPDPGAVTISRIQRTRFVMIESQSKSRMKPTAVRLLNECLGQLG